MEDHNMKLNFNQIMHHNGVYTVDDTFNIEYRTETGKGNFSIYLDYFPMTQSNF